MSGEMIATLGVGVALAGMILTSSRGLRQDIQQDIARLRADMKQLSDRVARLEHSQAEARRVARRITRGHHRTGYGQLGSHGQLHHPP